MRGKDPIETIMDLLSEDESRIDSMYFLMSEENVRKELAKPWMLRSVRVTLFVELLVRIPLVAKSLIG